MCVVVRVCACACVCVCVVCANLMERGLSVSVASVNVRSFCDKQTKQLSEFLHVCRRDAKIRSKIR